jgi:hypothetical protein
LVAGTAVADAAVAVADAVAVASVLLFPTL